MQQFYCALCWHRRQAILLCKSRRNFPGNVSNLATTSYTFPQHVSSGRPLSVQSDTCENRRRSNKIRVTTVDDSGSRLFLSDKQYGNESQWAWCTSAIRWEVTRHFGLSKQWPCIHVWSVSQKMGTSEEKFWKFMHMHSNTSSALPSSALTILFYIQLHYVVFTLRLWSGVNKVL